MPFEPVPWTLGAYAVFTLLRLWLAWRRRLPAWFLALSVVVDITVLMVTIWSFHLQYQEPAAIYLKAPTLMYVFILIALRTLRFEPGFVLLAGATGAIGWLVLVAYAVLADGGAAITHDFATYAMSYEVLLGAEVDKVVSILMVTLILALGLLRGAQAAVPGGRPSSWRRASCRASSRPRSPAGSAQTDGAIEPGQAELREAAILMVDLRGFTPLTHRLAPRRGDGAALRLPVAHGRRDRPATAAASTSSWATASSRASARRGRARPTPPTGCARSRACSRRPALGDASARGRAARAARSAPRSPPGR